MPPSMGGNHDQVPPPVAPIPLPAPDLRTMEELCQPTINGRGGPIAPIHVQATDFGLKNHMIQQEMVSKFLSKYFPPSMVTKLRNEISNFRQLLDESLFEAWERYKLSIDRCYETCGGPHHYTKCQAAGGFTRDVYAAKGDTNQMTKMEKPFNERPQGALPSNTVLNPRKEIKAITTRSGITLAGASIPPPPSSSSSKEVEQDPEPTL
ncbi:reverse transcriptase domain-containing protein, partial [Tanacetum coccineum]